MLHVMYLPKEENAQFTKILMLEYINDTYMAFTHNLISDLIEERYVTQVNTDELYQRLGVRLMQSVNKIVLNDVYRYVNGNNLSMLLQLIRDNNYSKNVYIGNVYIYEIIREVFCVDELSVDYMSIENILVKRLSNYIDRIYVTSPNAFNDILLKLAEMFYTHCASIPVTTCRFELAAGDRPIMIFTKG